MFTGGKFEGEEDGEVLDITVDMIFCVNADAIEFKDEYNDDDPRLTCGKRADTIGLIVNGVMIGWYDIYGVRDEVQTIGKFERLDKAFWLSDKEIVVGDTLNGDGTLFTNKTWGNDCIGSNEETGESFVNALFDDTGLLLLHFNKVNRFWRLLL